MKRFLITILPIVLLFGCNVLVPEDTSVNLDGEYVVDVVRATYINKIAGQMLDTTYTSGTFRTFSEIEPLDILQVGTEHIRFNGNQLMLDKVNEYIWDHTFYFSKVRDVVSQKESVITIYYFDTRRVFSIVDYNEDVLVLKSSGQWLGASPEGVYLDFTMILTRVN